MSVIRVWLLSNVIFAAVGYLEGDGGLRIVGQINN